MALKTPTPKLRAPLVVRSESFDLNLANYVEDDTYAAIRAALNKPRYRAVQSQETPRVISHWLKKGLLPTRIKDNEWRTFSIVEMAWLQLVRKIRSFDLSLEKISAVREQIMRHPKTDDRYPLLEFYTFLAMGNACDPYVVISSTGEADIGTMSEIESGRWFTGGFDGLLISLKGILEDMGLISAAEATEKRSFPMDEGLIALFEELRNKNNLEIRVLLDGKGGAKEMETIALLHAPLPSNYEISSDAAAAAMYGSVTTQYENGKRRSVKVVRKRRLNGSGSPSGKTEA